MAIRTTPRFVTPSDYRNYWGEDLDENMRGTDNISNQANMFLVRVENDLMAFIDANTFRVIPYDKLNAFQLEHFQNAILIQAKYVLKNSNLNLDSGYDMERGIVTTRGGLKAITVAESAIDQLKEAGLWSMKIKNRRRYIRLDGFGSDDAGFLY